MALINGSTPYHELQQVSPLDSSESKEALYEIDEKIIFLPQNPRRLNNLRQDQKLEDIAQKIVYRCSKHALQKKTQKIIDFALLLLEKNSLTLQDCKYTILQKIAYEYPEEMISRFHIFQKRLQFNVKERLEIAKIIAKQRSALVSFKMEDFFKQFRLSDEGIWQIGQLLTEKVPEYFLKRIHLFPPFKNCTKKQIGHLITLHKEDLFSETSLHNFSLFNFIANHYPKSLSQIYTKEQKREIADRNILYFKQCPKKFQLCSDSFVLLGLKHADASILEMADPYPEIVNHIAFPIILKIFSITENA